MRRGLLLIALLLGWTLNGAAGKKHSYLFAWCGDDDKKASDFLAVIDADPAAGPQTHDFGLSRKAEQIFQLRSLRVGYFTVSELEPGLKAWVRWIVMLIGGGVILAMIFYSLKSAHGG
jgi:hypothetical protein